MTDFYSLKLKRDSAETALQRHEAKPCTAASGTPEYFAWWEEERRLMVALRDAQSELDNFEIPQFEFPLFTQRQ